MKLEQSCIRELTAGVFPARVPVTARAQSSALQAAPVTCWGSVTISNSRRYWRYIVSVTKHYVTHGMSSCLPKFRFLALGRGSRSRALPHLISLHGTTISESIAGPATLEGFPIRFGGCIYLLHRVALGCSELLLAEPQLQMSGCGVPGSSSGRPVVAASGPLISHCPPQTVGSWRAVPYVSEG